MQMLKHRLKGSDVTAVQATTDNMTEIAAETGGAIFTSPRDTDVRYVIIETDSGSRRVDAGSWLIRHEAGEDVWYEVMAPDDFDLHYERP
jgi:hypothetical protein